MTNQNTRYPPSFLYPDNAAADQIRDQQDGEQITAGQGEGNLTRDVVDAEQRSEIFLLDFEKTVFCLFQGADKRNKKHEAEEYAGEPIGGHESEQLG